MPDVTRILSRIEAGDATATEDLLPLVYDELRKLAADRLAQNTSECSCIARFERRVSTSFEQR